MEYSNTYMFYVPENDKGQKDMVRGFRNIINDLAGGNTKIHIADGEWIDPSGLTVSDKIAVIIASGNFDSNERQILENSFIATLRDMGEEAVFYSLDGKAYIKYTGVKEVEV